LPKPHLWILGVVLEVRIHRDKGLLSQILFKQFEHIFVGVSQACRAQERAKYKDGTKLDRQLMNHAWKREKRATDQNA